jgi:hypothetical protein
VKTVSTPLLASSTQKHVGATPRTGLRPVYTNAVRRQDVQFVHVTVRPSVKFDVGPAVDESRCQHWKFAVPPATAEYGPEACGMLVRLH